MYYMTKVVIISAFLLVARLPLGQYYMKLFATYFTEFIGLGSFCYQFSSHITNGTTLVILLF